MASWREVCDYKYQYREAHTRLRYEYESDIEPSEYLDDDISMLVYDKEEE